jgi:hypothetical protein
VKQALVSIPLTLIAPGAGFSASDALAAADTFTFTIYHQATAQGQIVAT